jgi:microcystin-dependent protein
MSDQFIGEIRLFGLNFAPYGWATCQGQLLSINQNKVLFSLLGITYGGDGRSNFALPNLQGRVTVGLGQGTGLSPYQLGQTGGTTTVPLDLSQIAAHTHTLPAGTAGDTAVPPSPTVYLSATPGTGKKGGAPLYVAPATQSTSAVTMNSSAAGPAGGGDQPHNNMAPYLVLNYCIALQGIFPPRS